MSQESGSGDEAAAFWAYSLAVYDRPGIAAICLDLQDRHGLDVNLLLLCCWLGTRRRMISEEACRAVDAAVASWRAEIVEGLRRVRRALKVSPTQGAAALRRDVMAAELAAEREAQRIMLAALPESDASEGEDDAVAANLAAYLQSRGCDSGLGYPLVAALANSATGG